MEYNAISLSEKLDLFSEHWAPKIVAQLNDYHFKLVKIKGEFVWHDHPQTDEVFMVLDGEMFIEFRNGRLHLQKGELFVVPRGVEHKPFAPEQCNILLIEPAGTVNTGDVGGDLTAPADAWI